MCGPSSSLLGNYTLLIQRGAVLVHCVASLSPTNALRGHNMLTVGVEHVDVEELAGYFHCKPVGDECVTQIAPAHFTT